MTVSAESWDLPILGQIRQNPLREALRIMVVLRATQGGLVKSKRYEFSAKTGAKRSLCKHSIIRNIESHLYRFFNLATGFPIPSPV